MSITGSLIACNDNNINRNRIHNKCSKQQQQQSKSNNNKHKRNSSTSMGKNYGSSLNSSITNSVITTTANSSFAQQQHSSSHNNPHQQHQQQQQLQLQQKYMNSKRKHGKYGNNMMMSSAATMHSGAGGGGAGSMAGNYTSYLHLNSLWSIWYGVLLTLFQGYLAVHGAYRFLGCSLLPWKIEPVAELNLQIVLCGVVFILLPLFFTSAVFKVGNLANDGIKLAGGTIGRHGERHRHCSMTPHDGLEEEAHGGTLRALWTHGGPTAAFVHIVIALCLLLPRLLLEARIIENALLPRENIWHTELDFIVLNRRSLVALSIINATPQQNGTQQRGGGRGGAGVLQQLDDDEDDYYNDTTAWVTVAVDGAFSGAGTTGSGGHSIGSIAGIVSNNNVIGGEILKTSSNHLNRKQQVAKAKATAKTITTTTTIEPGEGGNASEGAPRKIANSFFEVPDLINSKERIVDTDVAEDDDGDDREERERLNGFGGHVKATASSSATSNEWRKTKAISSVSLPSTRTATSTTTTTTTTQTAKTTNSEANTNNNNDNRLQNKTYDKTWDKIGTLDKATALGGMEAIENAEDEDMPATSVFLTTTTATPSDSASTSTSTKAVTRPSSTTTITRASTSSKASTTTTKATTTRASKIISTTDEFPTTTTISTTVAAQAIESTTQTPQVQIQPTRMHSHHHHQQQQHHNQQQHEQQHQHHQHHHQNHHQHGKASGRKHGSNRHRQRNQRRQHHHTTSTTTTTSSAVAAAKRNSNEAELMEVLEFNRLDELEQLIGATERKPTIEEEDGDEELLLFDGFGGRARSPSTASTTTATRDSNIHIVKPERLPEFIIPSSTPGSSNSKIIEIKTKPKKLVKRMADEEMQVEIEPEYLIGELEAISNETSEFIATSSDGSSSSSSSSSSSTTNTANGGDWLQLDGFAGMLQIFFGIDKPIDVHAYATPPSAEFINLLFALMVWCVRYPAVFWSTTKSFATVFSVQIIAAALDLIFSYLGMANLYKLQVYSEAQPLVQTPGLILNGVVTLALFLLSTVLLLASSMIVYLYGHGRLAARMRARSLITLKSSSGGSESSTWIYFAHCASLCFVLALAVVKAPLLNDLSATYKQNLHCATFLAALISVVHLLLWIVIWLGLTLKRRWTFKLPPLDSYGLGKATTQPLLMPNRGSIPSSSTSNSTTAEQKGIIAGGGSHAVSNADSCGNGGVGGHGMGTNGAANCDGNNTTLGSSCAADNEDNIYWPKLQPSSPKLKVTFNEVTSTCDVGGDHLDDDDDDEDDDVLLIGDHEQTDGKRHTTRGAALCFASVTGEIDDGEYATLRAAATHQNKHIQQQSHNSNSHMSNINTNNATIVGIATGQGSIAGISGGAVVMLGQQPNKILHLSEYDELPPPPPQLMPMTTVAAATSHTFGHHNNNNSIGSNIMMMTGGPTISSDYANCGFGVGLLTANNMHATNADDNTSEEGKLLACVRDDSVTYASTRDLEPPPPQQPPPPPPPLPPVTAMDQDDDEDDDDDDDEAYTHPVAIQTNAIAKAAAAAAAARASGRAPQALPENMQLSSSPEHLDQLVSPLAPVAVTVHTNEAHIATSSSMTPRCLRRADSGMPNEALTPRSDTLSTTESTNTTSPPERAPSESSSGVHSGEERDVEVVIRPRAAVGKPPVPGVKPPAQPPIEEEPYGRCTNMRMSSFAADASLRVGSGGSTNSGAGSTSISATLPLTRSTPEQKYAYAQHCSTMPLPASSHTAAASAGGYSSSSASSMHQQQLQQQTPQSPLVSSFKSMYANSAVAMAGANAARQQHQQQQQAQHQQLQHQQLQQQLQQHLLQQQHQQQSLPPPPTGMQHTTLPNGVRYSNPHFLLRRLSPHVNKAAESPYGHLGIGAGHHTFSKLLHDPPQLAAGMGQTLLHTSIPEDRDSANYSMSSQEPDCTNLYVGGIR